MGCESSVSSIHYQTVIIGSGIAGVAAAAELSKMNRNVIILQANNYVGGRLKTTQIPIQNGVNFKFDQGASWIHGSCQENPITQLSKIVGGVTMKQTDDDSLEVFDQDGQQVQNQVQQAFQKYQKILQKCQDLDPQIPMSEAFQKFKNGVLNDKYVMYNVANDIQFQTSGSIYQLAASCSDDDQFQGKQMLIISGYQRFAETLYEKNNVKVFINHKVRKISYNQGINQIQCENGKVFSANNVIIAVPIGVLKSKIIQFYPKLPNWKSQAIQSIGFGNVCKIVIQFPNLEYITSTNHYIGVVSNDVNQRGLATYFLNIQAIAGIPILMTFGLGQNADQAQNMEQQKLKQIIAKRISAFSQEEIKSDEFTIYRTSWRNNSNFMGTYAYASTTTKPDHWNDMAKPVQSNNWYFCGEHTSFKYRGTVHGAFISGVQAAKFITKNAGGIQQHIAIQNRQESEEQPKKKKKNNEKQSSSQSEGK